MSQENYKSVLKRIKTFVFDVDGVFTANSILLTEKGEMLRTMNVRDGYAVQLAVRQGFHIVIISGGNSEAVRTRFEYLGVKNIFLGAGKKIEVFENYFTEKGLDKSKTLYMGDDIPDFEVMQKVGLACCPADATPEIKSISHYISPKNGGDGCVRDVLEQTMKVQGAWMKDEAFQW